MCNKMILPFVAFRFVSCVCVCVRGGEVGRVGAGVCALFVVVRVCVLVFGL